MKSEVSLRTLTGGIRALLESDEEDAFERLNALVPDLREKAVSVAAWIANIEDFAAAIKEREKKVVELRQSYEKRAEKWRKYLIDCLLEAEVYEISNAQGEYLKLKKNPPKVVIDNPEEIPGELWRVPKAPEPEPDKKLVAVAIKEGIRVPGAHIEQGWRVEIV